MEELIAVLLLVSVALIPFGAKFWTHVRWEPGDNRGSDDR